MLRYRRAVAASGRRAKYADYDARPGPPFDQSALLFPDNFYNGRSPLFKSLWAKPDRLLGRGPA